MMDALSKTTLSEAILALVMLVFLPLVALMLRRLRKYEQVFGLLPEELGPAAQGEGEAHAAPPVSEDDVPDDIYPYRTRTFLSPADRACAIALRDTFGEVDVYPHVALWTWVEASDPAPGYARRAQGKALDFLVCDRRTGMPLTGIVFNPEDAVAEKIADEARRICDAAGANLAFIDRAQSYDVHFLRKTLGLPVLDD